MYNVQSTEDVFLRVINKGGGTPTLSID